MITNEAVWLITGCSSGLGRALAEQALEAGYKVVATARDTSSIDDLVEGHEDSAIALKLDVTSQADIDAAVEAAETKFGSVDVLVNNAGYGYLGAIEEGEDGPVRAMFETDVFGPLNLCKAVLPGMRERGRGHIINISSVGGIVTYPAVGYYHMAKYAIEGLSDTLAKEAAPFGISVTVVAPGAFRTKFRGSSVKQSEVRLEAYADTAGKARDNVLAADGKQENDPVLGAQAIIKLVRAEKPPVHMAIGGDALDQIRQQLDNLRSDFDAWEDVARSTKFQAAA